MEFLECVLFLQTADSPLTEDQLDEVMTRLDTDGDGEVDLGYVAWNSLLLESL